MDFDWSRLLVYIPVVALGVAIFGYALKWIVKAERWMSKKDESIRFLEGAINELNLTIKELNSDIKVLFRNNLEGSSEPIVERKSPLRLTDRGDSISEALGVKAWATQTAQDVFPKLKLSLPYDIQVFCMDYVDHTSNFDTEFMERIKRYAYDEGLTVGQIRDVLAIELRDAILNKLPD